MFFCTSPLTYLFRYLRGLWSSARVVYIVAVDGIRRYLPLGSRIRINLRGKPEVCDDKDQCELVEEMADPGEKICDERDCLLLRESVKKIK
jgi:hypothetical protein